MENKLTVISSQELATTTYERFAQIWDPENIKYNLVQVKNVKQAIDLKTPSVGSVTREYGVKKTSALIKLWIIDLMASVNLKRPLTEHQIDEIALLILSEFNNVTLADIYLVLKNAKLGKYGSFYESLDCPKVMSWFNEYMEERISAHMNRSQTEHNQTKSASRTAESATEYLNKLQAKEYLKNNNT